MMNRTKFFSISFIEQKSLLILKWNKATINAKYIDFIQWNKSIKAKVEEIKPMQILVDSYNYLFPIFTEIKEWKGSKYVNLTNLMFKKIAYLVPFNYKVYRNLDDINGEGWECRYFKNEHRAYDWLIK